MNDNNIDKLFKNGLENIEYTPSGRVWKGIESKTVFKPFYIIYRKQLAIAAVLLLLITAGYFTFNFYISQNDNSLPEKTANSVLHHKNKPSVEQTVENGNNQSGNNTNNNGQNLKENNHAATVVKQIKENDSEYGQKTIEQNIIAENTSGNFKAETAAATGNDDMEISQLQSLSLSGLFLNYDYGLVDYNPVFEDVVMPYLEKRSNIHVWTGVSASASMVYYPGSRDMASYSAGLDVGLKLGRLYVVSGAAYTVMNEEGQYKIDFQSYDSVGYYNKVVSFEVNPQNPGQITYKTVKATVYDSVVHVNILNPKFKHEYFNIPLRMGYKFFEKERFSASVETGVVFSKLLTSHIPQPEFNNPDYKVIAVTRETPVRSNINWQWTLGLNLGYKARNGMSVSVAPVFSKYITNIYNSGNSVLPYSMGIRFGIYYDF